MTKLLQTLTQISDSTNVFLRAVAAFFLLVMVGTIGLQVFARYGFDSPPPWTEEVARYAMVWVGLLGATVSFKAAFDPKLVRLPKQLPRSVELVTMFIRGLAVFIFLAPVLWYSFFGPKINFVRGFLPRHWYLEAETFEMSTLYVAIGVPIFVIGVFLHGAARGLQVLLNPELNKQDQE